MSIILFLLYLILVFFGLINHEMWRDELEAWLISRDCTSIGELLFRIKYESHPPFWYLLLYYIGKVTHNPFSMQLLHLVIAALVILLFLKYSPFSKLQKILFCFSYFPFYEYAVISRNYSLVILFLFLICILFRDPDRNHITISLLSLLVAYTHVYGLFFSVCIQLTLLFRKDKLNISTKNLVIGLILFILGVFFLILQLLPPSDSYYQIPMDFKFNFYKLIITLGIIWRGYVPVPKFIYNYSDTNILVTFNDLHLQTIVALLSLGITILGIILFWKKSVPLFLYISTTLCVLFFAYLGYYGSLRHHGFLFMLFIVCLWISKYYGEDRKFQTQMKNIVLSFLLVIHFLFGIYAYTLDLLKPFSNAKACANYIKQNNLQGLPMIGSLDFAISPITAYLKEKVFYPASNRYGTYVIWDKQSGRVLEPQYLFSVATSFIKQGNKKVILLLNNEIITNKDGAITPLISHKLENNIIISKIKDFTGAIRADENYYIYLVEGLSF